MAHEWPQRKRLRLSSYDYSRAGAYFVTICTQNSAHLFGEICDETMRSNRAGEIVWDTWCALPERFPAIYLDAFVVIPNHVHGLLWLAFEPRIASQEAIEKATTLPDVIRVFKSISAIQVNRALGRTGVSVWQRSFYDRIVRSERALQAIRQYIRENPRRWTMDRYNPQATGLDPMAVEIVRWLSDDDAST